MSIMHTTLFNATSSFGLQHPSEMAYKAWRELQRARGASSTTDRRDAALNCAITAWHLIDWTWAGIAQADRRDSGVSALLGVHGRAAEKPDLIAWAERLCPELTLCQSICNGTKHVTSEHRLETRAVAPFEGDAAAGLVILDGTEHRDALGVLAAAVSFWGHQVTNQSAIL